MKKVLFVLLLCAAALAQRNPEAPPPPAPGTTGAPQAAAGPIPVQDENVRKARQLLDQSVQALGGQAWLTYRTKQGHGRSYSFYHGRPNSLGVQFWSFWKWPDMQRTEITKQRDVIYIYNGDKGYEKTYKGTRALEKKDVDEYLRARHYSLEEIFRVWLKQPGVALFYDGPTIAENKQAERVTIMNAQNESVSLDLDTLTHLPIRRTFDYREPDTGWKDTDVEAYDGYRLEDGINTPHTVTRYKNGDMIGERFYATVQYNTDLPDSMFQATVTYDPFKSPTIPK
jgi:hypothetical protein